MIEQLASFVLENRLWFGFALVAVLAFWYFRELAGDDGPNTRTGALKRVGDRTNDAAGGLLGTASALIFIVTSLLITIGSEVLLLFAQLSDVLAAAPVVAANALTTVIGVGALSGVLNLDAVSFAFWAALILLVALVWKVRQRM